MSLGLAAAVAALFAAGTSIGWWLARRSSAGAATATGEPPRHPPEQAVRRELEESQRMLATLLSNLPGMAYRCRLDGERTLELASEGCCELTGHPPADLVGRSMAAAGLTHPDDRDRVRREIDAAIAARRPFRLGYRIKTATGEERSVWDQGRVVPAPDGSPQALEGFLSDVSERVRAEEQLLHDAFHDRLTGLANRSLFMDRLERALVRTQRRPEDGFAVLFLDLDRFKLVNESLGHALGDQVLIAVAQRLEACLRQEDSVARVGGDEFALLLDHVSDPPDGLRIADRIRDVLGLPIFTDGYEVFAAASTGIALATPAYERGDELLRDAEIAMHRAKALGRGRHQVFDRTMHLRSIEILRLETDLRRALSRQEFELRYQPIVSLDTGRIHGFEALMRWRHPARGLVLPEEFISQVVETGLIVPLTWWVLREACGQLALWQERFPSPEPLVVSVNLSSEQLVQPDLLARLDEILAETGIAPSCLRLEITESAVMDNFEMVEAVALKIRKRDVQLSMDDFGTGYSSLSCLHRLPIDTLKIDRSFVSGDQGRGENQAIVRTIVDLAHSLDMDVVAEGVETEEQLVWVTELDCEFAQGFFFSRPLDERGAEELLGSQTPGAPAHFDRHGVH